MNIKRSLALQFSLIVAAILLVFSLLVFKNSQQFRHNEFYDRLKEKGFTITELLLEESDEIDTALLGTIERNNLNFLKEQRIFVYNNKQQLIYQNSTEYAEPDKKYLKEITKKNEVSFSDGKNEFAGFTFNHPNGKYYVIIGAYDESGEKKIEFLKYLLLQIFVISLIVTGFLGWFFAKRSLGPMVHVVNEVDQITVKNLHNRVKIGNNKDEIAHLAVTFNKMLDRLENSFTMQKNFVANASHEFRTPLTSMKGMLEVMLMKKRSEEDYIKTLTSINEDINNLIELLQGLSELAQVNTDFIEAAFEPIEVLDIIVDSRAELLKDKPKYTIDLDVQNSEIDQSHSMILGNTALLKSALKNLMDNACKFSPNQKVKVNILFDDNIIVQFIDDGIGISNEEIKHVFEPFYRGNDTRNISGHGIGLSLVKRIIELHNASVTVNSTQGIGTTFTLTFNNYKQDAIYS
jgi:signal transduction histidine kinase